VREGKRWSHEYALEVLARQLRPLAHEAFRLGNTVRRLGYTASFRPC
jgi:hypothetical protein